MEIKKLVDLDCDVVRYGAVFRFPGGWPYEDTVDFLLAYLPVCERESALVVATGHKAGLLAVMLPEESGFDNAKGSGISRQWITENWKKWAWPDCSVDDVYVINRYDVPGLPSTTS
ncbi:Imm45 family immunity protein [Cupriavidus sp. NPDC089707]|uniref:Imm45 family immunity protein n=1 Tax=Cupriavidus sp. NPDC089707 TaxID=3363963 RepID=UPI003826B535